MQSVVSSLGVMILGGNGQVLVCSRKCLKSSLPPQLCCPGVGCYSFCVADSGGGWLVGAWWGQVGCGCCESPHERQRLSCGPGAQAFEENTFIAALLANKNTLWAFRCLWDKLLKVPRLLFFFSSLLQTLIFLGLLLISNYISLTSGSLHCFLCCEDLKGLSYHW